MYQLTSNGSAFIAQFVLRSFERECAYADYSSFSVANEGTNYQLSIAGYTGTAG